MAGVPLAGTSWIRVPTISRVQGISSTAETKVEKPMAINLTTFAKENGIKYFMVSFTDLLAGKGPN